MKHRVLHITNGDCTTDYLKKLQFTGDFITWREMLCEGKTITDVGSEDFFKTRYSFLKDSYQISKQRFINYTIKEYRKLCNKKSVDEIVLWFEYDLFCQINLLAIISWLKRYRKGYQISLVCSGNVANTKKKLGLTELNEQQLKTHFKNRIQLSLDDIEYADYIWQLYCSESPLRLESIYQLNPSKSFQYLFSAIESHLQRFPSIRNGLNNEENFILQTAQEQPLHSKKQLIRALLKKQEIFGFGDVQYRNKIDKLHTLFRSFSPVTLSKKGKQALENEQNLYQELNNENSYLGGAKKYSFLYQDTSHKLLQITS